MTTNTTITPSIRRITMKIGDLIQERPDTVPESKHSKSVPYGRVVFIHPEGRYYSLWFDCGNGRGFTECRYFTPEEVEEGRRQGIFRLPTHNVTSGGGNNRSAPIGYRQMRESMEFKNYIPSLDDIDAAM